MKCGRSLHPHTRVIRGKTIRNIIVFEGLYRSPLRERLVREGRTDPRDECRNDGARASDNRILLFLIRDFVDL